MSIPEERYVEISRPGETSGGANSGEVRDLKRRLDQHIGSGGQAHAVATDTAAGFMSSDDKVKLDGVQNNATENMPDEYLLARGNHTGVQAIETVNGLREELNELGGSRLEQLTERAEDAADQAEAAADIASTAGRIFPASAEGQASAALSVGDYFWVESSNPEAALELWRKGSSSPSDTGRRIASDKELYKLTYAIEKLSDVWTFSENLGSRENESPDTFIDPQGSVLPSTLNSLTDFIPVVPGGVYSSFAYNAVAEFDSNKQFLVRHQYPAMNEGSTWTVSERTHFVRFNFSTRAQSSAERRFNAGASLLPYTPYTTPELSGAKLGADVIEQIREEIGGGGGAPIDDYISASTNLFDDSTSIKDNMVISATGEIVPPAGEPTDWAYSDWIKVSPGSYYFDGFRYIAVYDDDKNFIVRYAPPNLNVDGKYFGALELPANSGYVRVCYRTLLNNHVDIAPKVNKGSEPLPYEPPGTFLSGLTLSDGIMNQIRSEIGPIDSAGARFIFDLPVNQPYTTDAVWEEFSNFRNITSDEVYQMYDDLMALYPDNITKHPLGENSAGQQIAYYRFSSSQPFTDPDVRNPIVFLCCSVHGMEHTPPLATYLMLREAYTNWQSDPLLEVLRFDVDFVVIPVANPYGWDRFNRVNENGVDINRNFPADWVLTEPGALYSGPSPASELETQYIMRVFDEIPEIDICYDFHNFNGTPDETRMIWLSPMGFDDRLLLGMAKAWIRRMTRHWRKEYAFIPPDPYFAGNAYGGAGQGMLKNYALQNGIRLTATLELCNRWWIDPEAVPHDVIHKRTTMEALTNWILINLEQIAKT